MLLCRSSPVLCWQSLITVIRCWSAFLQSSWTDSRPSSTQQLVWSVMLWRQITLHLCWKTYTGYESRKGSCTSYVSLCSSVSTSLAPTYLSDQLQQVARMESRHHLRLSSLPVLIIPATRRSSEGDQAFLVAAARACNSLPSTCSHCCVNPAFIPSSPENSSIHHIFPTILVILSAISANVTCFWLC